MSRVIHFKGWEKICSENGQKLFCLRMTGTIEDATKQVRAKRTGGFWNCHVYEFFGPHSYDRSTSEPKLRWRFGVPWLTPAKIESEDFSGVITREVSDGHTLFRLGSHEWRFDEKPQELHFPTPDPKFELRVTALAFGFFNRCRPD